MNAFVYILASQKNGTLYTGSTTDLAKRLEQHRSSSTGFAAKYYVRRLVYVEEYTTTFEVLERERRIKRWKRAWKIGLIEKLNPSWDDLAVRPG